MKTSYVSLIFVLLLIYFTSCEETFESTGIDNPTILITEATITDQTGKRWDITHAANIYGFYQESFRHGLGPFAIRPILDPEMLSPGDPGYPAPDNDDIIIGVNINGDIRAYPLKYLVAHEIVNDRFDDVYVAIGY